MLSLHQISVHRGASLLVSDFSLIVSGGDAVWLTGPNGIGKSTLLRVMAGIQKPLSGAVQPRQTILYLPSELGFDLHLTLIDNLKWWARLFNAPRRGIIRPSLVRLGLSEVARLPFMQLSSGQQQRAALARLLLSPAKIWLLDEPLAHLDESGRKLAAEIMEEHLQKGGALVAATHDVIPLPHQRIIDLTMMKAAA